MWRFVKSLFGFGPPPEHQDGFGQTLLEDLRYLARFGQCRKLPVVWHPPSDEERAFFDDHPIFGRFGDQTYAVALVNGRQWVVRENDWYGWPDPSRFAFFALEGDTIWAAADFDNWPRRWTPGDGLPPI